MLVKDNQKDLGPKFTGGDGLTGLYKLYHEIMMKNELYGGYGAYRLSYAEGESGFSFGGNQMDLSRHPRKAEILVDILNQAKDEQGTPIFSQLEVELISGNQNENLTIKKRTLENAFGDNLIRINSALSSEYGRNKIDAAYLPEMKMRADYIQKAIESINNPAAKKFYDTIVGKAFLFDYHNQFNLSLDGKLMKDYIDGDGARNFTTRKKDIAPRDYYSMEDHIRYIHGTQQYHYTPESCKGRISKILAALEEFQGVPVNTVPEDISDFAFSFDHGTNRWTVYPELTMPHIPSSIGKQVFLSFGIIANYFLLPEGKNNSFKQRYFYYRVETAQLSYVSTLGEPIPFLGKLDNFNLWELVSVGLSAKNSVLPVGPFGILDPENYETTAIHRKKVAVQPKALLSWLEEVGAIERAVA